MRPLWFPTSALLDAELDCWASPVMLRLPLASTGRVTVRYVGDRMWPAFRHGEQFEVCRPSGTPDRGDAVVVRDGGNVELWRLASGDTDRLQLVTDADPDGRCEIAASELIGVVAGRRRAPPTRLRATLRRGRLDLAEAWRGGPAPEGARSVREKYDSQADGYATHVMDSPGPDWHDAIARHVVPADRIVVVGCGAGKECFSRRTSTVSCRREASAWTC